MRKTINPQPNLREPWLELEHARELETISSLLDAHPKLNELVLQDLKSVTPSAGSDVGRGGMSAEQVLRALLVKQLNQFSYRELAFHLADSRSYRTFCQLGIIEPTPSKSTLAANIKAVKFETLEQINRELVSVAEDAGIEKGRKVRVDCTVVGSNIHPPTDSELLYDCVRVLTRLMCGARELLGTVVVFGNRTRRAKRRRLGVLNAKDKQQRRRVYRDLLKVTEETYRSAQRVAEQLEESGLTEPVKRASTERTAADFAHFLVLTKKVINQTQRRVIDEERVPAEEKVVSVFEEHTDIIRKDRRETPSCPKTQTNSRSARRGRLDRHQPVASPRSGGRRRCRRFEFPVRAGKTLSSKGMPGSRAETWVQARAAPGPERVSPLRRGSPGLDSRSSRDESANKRPNHAGMVSADRRLIKFGARE